MSPSRTILKRAREFEEKIADLHRDNSLPIQDVMEARFQVARAEAWFHEAKRTKAKENPKKRDADSPSSAPPVVPSPGEAVVEKKPTELSEKQKAAGEAKRKEVADYPFLIVGYNTDEKEWMTCVYDSAKRYEWRRKAVDLWKEKDSFQEVAKQKADDKSIATTVLVDLTSDKEPVPVVWFFKQGDVLKRSAVPPRPELAVSLVEYLKFIRANPGLVKVPEQ